jgi:glycopeptide antibiotics resistance protein
VHKTIKQIIFYSYLALVFYLTLTPGSNLKSIDKIGIHQLLNFENSDKLVHGCMFFGLAFLYQQLEEHTLLKSFLVPFCISFLIEILQGIMPFGRSFDWLDLLANSIGILIAIGSLQLIKKAKSF